MTLSESEFKRDIHIKVDDHNIAGGTLAGNIQSNSNVSNANLITAIYDRAGGLKYIDIKPITIENGGNLFNVGLGLSDFAEGDYYILYLWEDMNALYSRVIKGGIAVAFEDKAKSFINDMHQMEDFVPTGLTKEYYLDVIEKCVRAYSPQELESMTAADDIQTYARIVNALGILNASGRMTELRSLWETMMTNACTAIDLTKKTQETDFAVKELMIAYIVMSDNVTNAQRDEWLACLEEISPSTHYTNNSGSGHNINIYTLAGEWLRDTFDMTDSTEYFEACWPSQLQKFDQNGMYMDNYNSTPNKNPILYDLTTRVQMQLIAGFGYQGEFAQHFNEILTKGGYASLFMQSAAFEMPYGGRSNQYLFNEGLMAANFEYEAARHKAAGDLKTAGAYKRAAHLTILSIDRWLDAQKHIKNFYNGDSVGTESYGYYNKYMITLASFISIGYLLSNDDIEELSSPAEIGGYVFETSNSFNKIFANCGGYSVEIDTNADLSYDSTGLGRIHKKGIPTELGLSMPFTATPGYTTPSGVTKTNLSIDAGWDDGMSGIQYLSSMTEINHVLTVSEESADRVVFRVEYTGNSFKGCDGLEEIYTIDEDGVSIAVSLINPIGDKIYFRVPLLYRNGNSSSSSQTDISNTTDTAVVTMGSYRYNVSTDGTLSVASHIYGNRNGEYKAASISKESSKLNIHLSLRGNMKIVSIAVS